MMRLRDILQKKQAFPSLREMPMSAFIDFICQLKPEPKNWNALIMEYQEISKDSKSNILLSLLKEITYTENNVFIIQSLCSALSMKFNEKIAIQLRAINPRYKYQKDDRLTKELQLTYSATKSTLIRLREKKAMLNEMQKASETDKPKPSDWDLQFIYLSKHLSVHLTPKNTMVTEYVAAINDLKQTVKLAERNGK